jgi:hypothetical protein
VGAPPPTKSRGECVIDVSTANLEKAVVPANWSKSQLVTAGPTVVRMFGHRYGIQGTISSISFLSRAFQQSMPPCSEVKATSLQLSMSASTLGVDVTVVIPRSAAWASVIPTNE